MLEILTCNTPNIIIMPQHKKAKATVNSVDNPCLTACVSFSQFNLGQSIFANNPKEAPANAMKIEVKTITIA